MLSLLGPQLIAFASASAFPLYRQCDPRWGNHTMGTVGLFHRSTICAEGCFMSCMAMLLQGMGFASPAGQITPDTLNAWLIAHKGYLCAAGDCDNFVLTKPEEITGGRVRLVGEWPTAALQMTALPGLGSHEAAYFAHVRNPQTGHTNHFVLLQAYDNATDRFTVLDPMYNVSYARVNVSDVIVYELLPARSVVPLPYPLFKQCDPAWGGDRIHVKTVCAVGCLMSSTAMALSQRGIHIPAASGGAKLGATPGTLNSWLLAIGGYVGASDDLDETAIVALDPSRISWTNASMHQTNDLSWSHIVTLLNVGAAVIANVDGGRHFVLVVGVDKEVHGNTLYVNDPGFYRASYTYDEVVGWRLYGMLRDEEHNADAASAMREQIEAIAATRERFSAAMEA